MAKKQNSNLELLNLIQTVASGYQVSQAKVGDLFSDSVLKVLNKFLPDRVFQIEVNLETGEIISKAKYVVVDNLPDGDYDDFNEIPLDASKQYGDYKVGDQCLIDFNLNKELTKQQITNILHIFKQKLGEINNAKVYDEWAPKIGQIINAEVEKGDKSGFYIINLENNNFGFLSKKECIPGEILKPGNKYQFLIKEVKEHSKGWPVILSRADPEFVKKLLFQEVPEIATGEVKINVIKRIPGFKTKIAVSNAGDSNFDPAAVVVGSKGMRIKNLSNIINNEKIEVIRYSDNFKDFLLNVCGQNNLVGYKIILPKDIPVQSNNTSTNDIDLNAVNSDEGNEKTQDEIKQENKPHVTLVVNDAILPVIIGKKGFNIKLIAMMLNCSIDINTVEQANKLNLDYEKVINVVSSPINKPIKTPANKLTSSHVKIQHKMTQSNDDLLDDLSMLSTEEIEQKYHIDITSTNNVLKENQTKPKLKQKQDEIPMLDDYEDMDLSEAFSDEIANLINDEENKK